MDNEKIVDKIAKSIQSMVAYKTYRSRGNYDFSVQIHFYVKPAVGKTRTVRAIVDAEKIVKKMSLSETRSMKGISEEVYWGKEALVVSNNGIYVVLNGEIELIDNGDDPELIMSASGYMKENPMIS